MYEKQHFRSGESLKASQLEKMEEGIISAERLAIEVADSAANMEKSTSVGATQQLQNQESGVTDGYFNFVGKNPAAIAADPSLNAELKYGAVGEYSASFGGKSTAIGKRALSEGTTTVAKGAYSHAEGNNSVTLGANSHAEGKCTVTIGENSHSEGYETIAGAFNSHAEGYNTCAEGPCSHTEGKDTIAKGENSHSEGASTAANGNMSHAEGWSTRAEALASHAEGKNTIAEGYSAHAEGKNTIAEGYSAHAEGEGTAAKGNYSHAEGLGTIAKGNYSHSEGKNNIANGEYSHAGGEDSIADYSYNFVHGIGLHTTYEHQTVFGKFNDASDWGDNRPLFMIGNGTDTDHRSNAFEVRNNGLVVVGNKVQQLPRADKVTQAEGETALHFNFTGHSDAGMAGRIQYGAVGNYSASMNGRSAALNKHAFAINNSTVAKGEESFAQGYETIAEGNSSFAGGSKTWAKGAAAVALGSKTKALGEYSFTNGVHTVAGHAYQTVVGVANENNVESLFEVGNGELDADGNIVEQSTAFRVMRNGKVKIKDIWAKEDDDVIALGFLNYHLNEELLPKLEEAINEELDTFRPYLVLTSDREDKTSAQLASCTASGAHSVAFGHTANTFSAYTCAIGKNVSASGDHSIVMGVNSHTSATAAFAVGVNANANGAHSRALGTNVNAGYVYQTVIGRNNANKENTLFEIGGGNGEEGNEKERWNVFEVYSDGRAKVYGEATEDNDVVTKKYVDDLVGQLQTALNEVLAIQNSLIGGNA